MPGTPDSFENIPPIGDTITPAGSGGINFGDNKNISGGNPNLTKNPPSSLPGSAGGPSSPGNLSMQPPTPEEKLNNESAVDLYLSYRRGLDDGVIENSNDIAGTFNYWQELGWTLDRLNELMNQFDIKNIKEFIPFIINKKYEEEINQQGSNTGVNPQQGTPGTTAQYHTTNRSDKMSKEKIVLNADGTISKTSAVDAKEIINKISVATRKAKISMKNLSEVKFKKAAIFAIRKLAEEIGEDDEEVGAMMSDLDLGGAEGEGGSGSVSEILENLKGLMSDMQTAFDDLSSAMGEGGDFEEENVEEIGFEDGKDLGEAMEEGEEIKAALSKAIREVQSTMDFMKGSSVKKAIFEKKEDKEDKKDKKDDKDDKKDKKDDKKEDKKASTDEIVQQIANKLAEIRGVSVEDILKEAQLYPFKDLNKQTVDNTNAETATGQAKTINSDMSGGFQPDGERADSISPTEIGEGTPKVEKGSTGKPVGKVDSNVSNSKKVSDDHSSRVRQHEIQNAIDKTKLSFELAARQQLKGLLASPLKEAFVKEMVTAGVDKTAADAIAHNAFIEGFEENQKVIFAELNTFLEKDVDEFVKIATFTKEYVPGTSTEEIRVAAEEGTEERTKTASVDVSNLRASQVNDVDRPEYRSYWEDVSRRLRKW